MLGGELLDAEMHDVPPLLSLCVKALPDVLARFEYRGYWEELGYEREDTLKEAQKLAAVCSAWHEAIAKWNANVQGLRLSPKSDAMLVDLSAAFKATRKVTFESCLDISQSGLLDFVRSLPKLSELGLSICCRLPDLPKLFATAPCLQKLALSNVIGSSSSEMDLSLVKAAPHAKALVQLDIRNLENRIGERDARDNSMTIAGLAGALKFGFPNLKKLDCPYGILPADALRMHSLRPDLKISVDSGPSEGANYYRAL